MNTNFANTGSSKLFKSTERKYSPMGNSYYDENKVMTNTGSFNFLKRSSQLKWKELSKIDIEDIIRKNNINDLEPYLNNLIFGSVEENDLDKVSEEHVVKLVKLFQYSLEYLFYYQQKLENQISFLQNNYNLLHIHLYLYFILID